MNGNPFALTHITSLSNNHLSLLFLPSIKNIKTDLFRPERTLGEDSRVFSGLFFCSGRKEVEKEQETEFWLN